MASPTPWKNYTYPAHGGAVNTWDTPIDADFDQLDLNLGGNYPIVYTSTNTTGQTFLSTATSTAAGNIPFASIPSTNTATVTLPTSMYQNLHYAVSGTIANSNQTMSWPFGLGAIFDVSNLSSGAYTFTINPAGGGTTYTVNQGGSSILVSDGTNILLADSNENAAELYTYLGNPNGNRAGTAGNTNGSQTDVTWDAADQQLYLCTTTGNAAAAAWTAQLSRVAPGGYLSLSADPNNPVISTDTTGTTLTYYPYTSNWMNLSTGTALFPYQFPPMSLYLTNSQSASLVYDVFAWPNITLGVPSPIIGVGPAWSVSTPGSGSRGTGAGTTQLTRTFSGILTNAVSMNLTYNPTGSGNTTTAIAANSGVYLGSIYIDATAGQITCHRSFGQNRKFGVWNYFNRVPINLMVGDPTSSWNYTTAVYRASNNTPSSYSATAFNYGSGTACNGAIILNGAAEEEIRVVFYQEVNPGGASGNLGQSANGVGWNSISSPSGNRGFVAQPNASGTATSELNSRYIAPPSLGLNIACCIENAISTQNAGGSPQVWYGTNTSMQMVISWRG